jgi:hypothetical protein
MIADFFFWKEEEGGPSKNWMQLSFMPLPRNPCLLPFKRKKPLDRLTFAKTLRLT